MSIKKIWLSIGFVWVAIVFYLSLGHVSGPIDIVGIDKLYHLITYGFLSLWFLQVSKKNSYISATITLLIFMGVLLEFLQGMTPHRMFEYHDMIANSIGVIIGWALSFTKLGNVLNLVVRSYK